MKTDTQLHADVLEELRWEPSIDDAEIGVAVKDGVVTLSGYVETFAQKYDAERAVKRVSGVSAVAEELKVRRVLDRERTDSEIAHAVVNALRWHVQVPDKVSATVERGWVELRGVVEWQYQRNAAENAVRFLAGVNGMTNLIEVKPKVATSVEVSRKIKDALRRSAELDAEHIHVAARDGTVTLTGSVRSWGERGDAERAAWAAPGVTAVKDLISVGI